MSAGGGISHGLACDQGRPPFSLTAPRERPQINRVEPFDVVGKLTVTTDQGAVGHAQADLELHFDCAGYPAGASGRAQMPSPSPEVELTRCTA